MSVSLRSRLRLVALPATLAFASAASVSLTFLTSATAYAAATVDQPAPAFSAATADGKSVDLNGLRGKTVVLEWTNNECPFVPKHYESGNMQRLQQEASTAGVVWLQVLSSAPGKQGYADGPTALRLNSARSAVPSAVILDPQGKLGRLYGAQTTPHLFVIDAKGTLVYKGGIDSIASADKADIVRAEPYVANALAALAAGRKIAASNTRPYGCSIKYE